MTVDQGSGGQHGDDLPAGGDGQVAEHLPREQRRRRTEAAILQAAKELFAESGFERTTIRAVASRAGIDPALVMQYYGSKDALFAAAARMTHGPEQLAGADRRELPAAALAEVFELFERADGPESAVTLLRNCLTHPGAAQIMRDEVMCERSAVVAAKLEGPDAELRAQLFGACLLGMSISRAMLGMEPLASASHEDILRLFEPALRALTDPTT